MPESRRLHWKEGRSAYELGREWTINGVPATPGCVDELLNSHSATRCSVLDRGVTEFETPLPFGSRGARCHDLVLWGARGDSRLLVCVEAKADEPFGGDVAAELQNARKRPVTRFPDRLAWLTACLLGIPAFVDTRQQVLNPQIANLPYQLLTAVAGTLLEADRQRVDAAVLLIHEFRTHLTSDENLAQNARCLDEFLRTFLPAQQYAGSECSLDSAQMLGPIQLHPARPGVRPGFPTRIPLFLGKIRTDRMAGSLNGLTRETIAKSERGEEVRSAKDAEELFDELGI
ncbi:MAG: hypothetical protein WAL73_05435 [Terracidiphilus sp.]